MVTYGLCGIGTWWIQWDQLSISKYDHLVFGVEDPGSDSCRWPWEFTITPHHHLMSCQTIFRANSDWPNNSQAFLSYCAIPINWSLKSKSTLTNAYSSSGVTHCPVVELLCFLSEKRHSFICNLQLNIIPKCQYSAVIILLQVDK